MCIRDRRIDVAILAFYKILEGRLKANKRIHMVFIDTEKVFDKVN